MVRRIRQYQVSAVVIRQHPLGEADRRVTLYTRERGKLSAVAKGVNKPRSKFAAGLQLFSHARIQLAAGRSLEVVTQVQPVDMCRRLREDWARYTYACYVAELLDALTDEQAPDPACFDLLLATLQALDAGGEPATLVRGFELKLLAHLGYGPELNVCASCGADLSGQKVTGSKAGFSVAQGGVVCGRCLGGQGGMELSAAARRAMNDLVQLPPQELAGRRLRATARKELARVMRSFVDYHLARPLRSASFLCE